MRAIDGEANPARHSANHHGIEEGSSAVSRGVTGNIALASTARRVSAPSECEACAARGIIKERPVMRGALRHEAVIPAVKLISL